jgi:hypothetical protein
MALVARSGHPLAATAPTIEQVADAIHIVVSRRGRLRGPVDEVLEARGLRRRVAAALPSFAAALAIVQGSDTVCVLPRRLGVPEGRALTPLPLPFSLRSVPAVVSWHHRHDSDPAHRWMRGIVAGIISMRLELTRGTASLASPLTHRDGGAEDAPNAGIKVRHPRVPPPSQSGSHRIHDPGPANARLYLWVPCQCQPDTDRPVLLGHGCRVACGPCTAVARS